jgi:serine/threonine protein kinase
MPDATCPTCGSPMPLDAPGGACPKCLLHAGLHTEGGPHPDRLPSIEELAPLFPQLEIGTVLGRGGMGVVYRARHKALDRDVALKILPAWVAADRAFADRFQREARALARLQHPNIVAVHDFGETQGHFWLQMEYVDGVNIRQAMHAGRIGPKEALAIVPQICDALQYAHERGVVHRDIKPENVLLDKDGRVKVADFGLAKLMEHATGDRTLTGVGQVMGTPHYMAPEQVEHPSEVDHRADIYSLGVVFYEMLTGELPLGRFAAPSTKSEIDARIDEIVMRTLEKEREARYQRAVEVKTDVGRLSAEPAEPPPPLPPPTPATPPPLPTRRPGTLAWIVGGLAALSSAIFVLGAIASGESAVILLATVVAGLVVFFGRRLLPDFLRPANDRPRFSRLAIFGVLGVPLAVFTFLLFWAGAPVDPNRHERALATAAIVLVLAWAASVAAWVRIRESRGMLHGLPLAIAGTVLPVLAGCLAGPFVYFNVGTPEGAAKTSERGERRTDSAADATNQIRDLFDLLKEVHPRLATKFTDAERFYDRTSWSRISRLSGEDREARARFGQIGLPLADAQLLGTSLDEFSGLMVTVDQDTRSAHLRASTPEHTITAKLRFGDRGWRFTDEPIDVRAPDPGARPNPAATDLQVLYRNGGDDRQRIAQLWDGVRRLVGPTPRIEEVAGLYPDRDLAALRELPIEDLIAQAQSGSLGLPLYAMTLRPQDLNSHRIGRIVIDPDGTGATVEIVGDKSRLRFRLTRSFRGETQRPRYEQWLFAMQPVEKE